MLKLLSQFADKKYYWLSLALLCVLLEAVALFYQYVLNYGPCILCIHVRIIVLGMFIISVLALCFRYSRFALLVTNVAMVMSLAVLLERSYMLLGVERGFVTGSCGFDSGLPSWFAIDKWFPFMFKIWESCGYTPVLLFGITMAEALIVMSAVLLLLSGVVTVNFVRQKFLGKA